LFSFTAQISECDEKRFRCLLADETWNSTPEINKLSYYLHDGVNDFKILKKTKEAAALHE
jgi:hypothetical protein